MVLPLPVPAMAMTVPSRRCTRELLASWTWGHERGGEAIEQVSSRVRWHVAATEEWGHAAGLAVWFVQRVQPPSTGGFAPAAALRCAAEPHQQADAHGVANLHVGQVLLQLRSLQLVHLRAPVWEQTHVSPRRLACPPKHLAGGGRRRRASGDAAGPAPVSRRRQSQKILKPIADVFPRAARAMEAPRTRGARRGAAATIVGCARLRPLATSEGRCCVKKRWASILDPRRCRGLCCCCCFCGAEGARNGRLRT